MGRYTTVQTYTDQDAKVAAISYSSATTVSSSSSSADALASVPAITGDGGLEATKKQQEPSDESKFHTNRVENVSGSSAGAGSGDFHMYRASRRREIDRVEQMEKKYAEKKLQEEFELKRKRNLDEFESRAQKQAEKRRRRKERAKAKAMDDATEQDEETTKKSDTKAAKSDEGDKPAVKPTDMPGGVPEIPNDGSFLEKMLAMQKQKDEKAGTKSGK